MEKELEIKREKARKESILAQAILPASNPAPTVSHSPAISGQPLTISPPTSSTFEEVSPPVNPELVFEVPLGSTEQCQAPSSLGVEPPQTLTFAPGPKLAPAPNFIKDPPTGDPPTGMELTTAHGQSPVHDSSSPSPLSLEDEPPADLTFTPLLDDQELPDQESAWSLTLMTAVAAAGVRASPAVGSTSTTVAADTEVGCFPAIPQATTASAPDSISGLTPESVPPSTPKTGLARPWRNKKKKKGRTKLTH
ncbi:mucin-2-like [Macrobrachium nipponense]|uniref:mucin-2-like n=1 Tax=Macrobrachium nipponense TaxID=159736 RepID=UPI0030C8CA4B